MRFPDVPFTIEVEQEDDGRWLAGDSRRDRLEHGEAIPQMNGRQFGGL